MKLLSVPYPEVGARRGGGARGGSACTVSRPGSQHQEEGESVLLAAATVTTAELQHRQCSGH